MFASIDSPTPLSSAELKCQIEVAQHDLDHAKRMLEAAEADAVAAAGAGEAAGGNDYLVAQSAVKQAGEEVQSHGDRVRRLEMAHAQAADRERVTRINELGDKRGAARSAYFEATKQLAQYQKTAYVAYRRKLESLEKECHIASSRLRDIDREVAELTSQRKKNAVAC